MKYLGLFFLSLFIFSCDQQEKISAIDTNDSVKISEPPSPVNEYLITDTSFGQIIRSTTYDDLKKMFGSNIADTIAYGAEGLDSFIVTKAYSNTSKEIVISWYKNNRKAIAEVYSVMENSPYHTIEGLQVGSTLKKLLDVNGKKINFYGTGWDYGGAINSFNNGKFEKSNIFFSLDARENAEDVMGDQELNTDMPRVKQNLEKLYIGRIAVLFNYHPTQ